MMRNLTARERLTLVAHLRGPQNVKATDLNRLRRLADLGLIRLLPPLDPRPKFSRMTSTAAQRLACAQARNGAVFKLLARIES